MDLRALALRGAITHVTTAESAPPAVAWQPSGQAWEPLLMAGCVIAQEMRAALKVRHNQCFQVWFLRHVKRVCDIVADL